MKEHLLSVHVARFGAKDHSELLRNQDKRQNVCKRGERDTGPLNLLTFLHLVKMTLDLKG